ncbi:MAG: site-specific integrase, partial [Planctomycetota bacterium]
MIKQTDRHIMEESTIIQKFLDYLKFERRFSEHTAKCYGADLAQFGEFLKGAPAPMVQHAGPVSLARHEGESEHGVAVATQVRVEVDQLLVSVQTDSVRAYLAHLNEKEYS